MICFRQRKRIMIYFSFATDYKRTSLAKYVKLFDQFVESMARSRKGELLKKSGT